ncbi:MAG TPA: DUF4349 domain-containing protein [Bacteroidia bacterium]|nr:DUF4349 domain-containing protein [Bacteroidia bacterium]
MNSIPNCSVSCKAVNGREITLLKILIPLLLFLLTSCGADAYEKKYFEEQAIVADSISKELKGLYGDTINGITHHFVRKADVKMKVKSVIETAKKIEAEAKASGGFTSLSELSSEIDHRSSAKYNEDSLIEQTFFNVSGKIKLHVLANTLDSVLQKITEMGLFIDHRRLNADDVKMEIFANLLAENRFQEYRNKTEKFSTANNTKQQVVLRNNILQKQELADSKRIENYEMTEKINYSVIDLEIYQDKNMSTAILPLVKNIPDYQPSFFVKLGDSLQNGFTLLKNFILFFANLWSIILILLLLFFAIRKTIQYYSKTPLNNSVIKNKT